MIELMLVMSVLVGAFLVLSRSLTASMRLTQVNSETAVATDAIRGMLETLSGAEDFSQIFALYNEDPDDDPVAAGSAPGASFAVLGLSAASDDPDGMVGAIAFPAVDGATGLELREDVDDPEMGMPRDLNGDGAVDSNDHSADYALLPVVVRLRWQGASGIRSMEARTLIADR